MCLSTANSDDKIESMLEVSIAETAASIDPSLVDPEELRRLREENQAVQGNANEFVPWSDPGIPYHCECGEIIYADTPHTHE